MKPGDRVTHTTSEIIGIIRKFAGSRALVRWTVHTSAWCERRALRPRTLILRKPTNER
jgi:hypothetical protein